MLMGKPENRDSLYGRRWRKVRAAHLRNNPLCAYCARQGLTTLATVVDHIKPHRGDPALFWDETNWQSLCQPCHDSIKQAEEKSGVLRGVDTEGQPVDPSHHWNVA
jgi:5-methylcytosine-specific restriction endonuclease McrA